MQLEIQPSPARAAHPNRGAGRGCSLPSRAGLLPGRVDGSCRQDPHGFASLFAAFGLKCSSGYPRVWGRGVGCSLELWGPSLHLLGCSDIHEPSAGSHFHEICPTGHISSGCGAVRMTIQLLLKNLFITSPVNDIPVLCPHPGRMP